MKADAACWGAGSSAGGSEPHADSSDPRRGLEALYLCLFSGALAGFLIRFVGAGPINPFMETANWKWALFAFASIAWFPYAIWRMHLRNASMDQLVAFLVLMVFVGWELMIRLDRMTWGLGGGC